MAYCSWLRERGDMEIEHLREFAILARHLNFREAAADLHISQSALSRHIAALEQFYGTALFKRDRHAVYLTDAGAFLLDYAEQLWEQFSLSREHLQRLFPESATCVSAASSGTLRFILTSLMRKLACVPPIPPSPCGSSAIRAPHSSSKSRRCRAMRPIAPCFSPPLPAPGSPTKT